MSSYNQVIEDYFEDFRNEWGERKLRQITQKIHSSKKIKNLMNDLAYRVPFTEDIVYPVMSIPYFVVARRPFVILGCLIVIEIWNSIYNESESYVEN